MKTLLLILLLAIPASAQYVKLQGIAERGGQSIYTSGQPSTTKSIKTFPFCTVTVYNAGTLTLSTIYSTSSGTAKANPFTSDGNAGWFAFVAAGTYDVRFSGPSVGDSITVSGITVSVPSGVTSFNGRTGAVVPAANDYTAAQIGSVSQNKLLGRGASSGTGVVQEITLGTGLALSGTTLQATGGAGIIGGSGTINKVPKFTGATTIGDSNIQDVGSGINVTVDSFFQDHVSAINGYYVGAAGTTIKSATDSTLRFTNLAGTNFTSLFFGLNDYRMEFGTSTGGTGDFNFFVGADASLDGATLEAASYQTQLEYNQGFKARNVNGSVNVTATDNGFVNYSAYNFILPKSMGTNGQIFKTTGTEATWANVVGSGSGSLNYAQASANTCESLTLTLTGAADGDVITLGVTHTLANHNTTATFFGWASAADTVSVRRCVISADGSDPAAATVSARKVY